MTIGEPAVTLERKNAVALLTMNRPEQRNAMSAELVHQLMAELLELDHAAGIGAVVLAGAGKGFCAGSDIGRLAAMTSAGRAAFEADSGRLARLVTRLSKPVVAAVHGFAIGGGLTLATSCDIVVTDANSKWSLPEVSIGLFPAWGIASVTARAGLPFSKRLCWGLDTLSGAEAVARGLADVLAADPLAEALSLAERLCALPRAQAEGVKRYFAGPGSGEAADDSANALFMEATRTPEAEASFIKYGRRDK